MTAIDIILAARTPAELFPVVAEADARFKKLQRQVHPDLNPTRQDEATAAFVKLTEFHKKLSAGPEVTTFVTKKGSYTVGHDVWRSSGVRYRSVEGTEETWMAYVASPAAQGPFTEGHRNLAAINRLLTEKDALGSTTFRHFIPSVLDQFKLGTDKVEARILSAEVPGTRWFPLSSFTTIDPRDIAWIARRVFIALDLIHEAGYLHGSPHLEAIIIEPEKHGVMLKDWQYSVRLTDPLQLVDPAAKAAGLYPSWSKDVDATATGKLDIMVAAGGFHQLARASAAPPWMQDFFKKLSADPTAKAVTALNVFTKLLDDHWDRSFHPMSYPR